MKRQLFPFVLAVFLAVSGVAWAAPDTAVSSADAEPPDKPGLFATFGQRLIDTWNADGFDLYLTMYTWHNRFMYGSKVSKYNELPWGGGVGRSIKDEDGDLHALYAVGFMDSNHSFMPMLGYAFVKNWHPDAARDWALGVGYTLSIVGRHEYDYIPLPLPLPIFSLEYKSVALQAAYVPGNYNEGNVLFCWLRVHF